jgi:hypothetical protein
MNKIIKNKKRNLSPTALNTTGRDFDILATPNLGKTTLGMTMNINTFCEFSDVFNKSNIEKEGLSEFEAQRELSIPHASGIALYILKGMITDKIEGLKKNGAIDQELIDLQNHLGKVSHAALQPFTCNIRSANKDGSDLNPRSITEITESGIQMEIKEVVRVTLLGSKHRLAIVDGQHRREGFEILRRYLRDILTTYKYPKKGLFTPDNYNSEKILSDIIYNFFQEIHDTSLTSCYVKIECHLGLEEKEEKQLFTDLNNRGKKVEQSLALHFDTSDAINVFVKDSLITTGKLSQDIVIKDTKIWEEDAGSILRKDINPITCYAMFGHMRTAKISPEMIRQRKSIGLKFWHEIQQLPHYGKNKSRQKTIAAQSVVLKGLARLVFDLAYGLDKDDKSLKTLWTALGSGKLDFSHTAHNGLWHSLMSDEAARNKNHPGIDKYVYVKPNTNLDAGTFNPNEKLVRYGSKHNDILQRINDLIRYKLDFKPRKQRGFN